MHNWVSSGHQRHVDPVHSRSPKEQREAGERRVAHPAVWRRDSILEGHNCCGRSRSPAGSGADVLAAFGEVAFRRRRDAERDQPSPSLPTSLVSASLLTLLISPAGCPPSSSPTRSQLSSMFSAFKASESSNSTASNPGHPTTLTLSVAGSFVSCGERITVHCQRRSRLASKRGNSIRRTSCLCIRGDFGCSPERGRGESDVREGFRGSRMRLKGCSTPVCRVPIFLSVGIHTL